MSILDKHAILERNATLLLVAAAVLCVTLAWIRWRQGHDLVDALVSAVTLAVAKRKGANAITVAHQVEAKLAAVRPTLLPGDLNVTVTRNYGETAAEKSNELLEERVRLRTEELEEARIEVLERLARAAEFRDDATGQHTQRVGRLAAQLARALDRPASEVELIRRARRRCVHAGPEQRSARQHSARTRRVAARRAIRAGAIGS